PATAYIYTLSLHDALPILCAIIQKLRICFIQVLCLQLKGKYTFFIIDFMLYEKLFFSCNFLNKTGYYLLPCHLISTFTLPIVNEDRKSTRLNSSHVKISYA